ncbi:LmeA family phospholipid-binding protein [Catellatospora methionotrophica]|uniref:LmeA family phospholipid-binding protein n=1 Tax=Catellatospora methionotrophica TaxID=121620 RepID=UPI0033C1D24B
MKKLLTITAVAVFVLGVLVVVADRAGAHYAEREIAARVSARMQDQGITSAPPEVEIQGFPFLTQVAAGRYTQIDITMRDLKGGQLPLPLLNVAAHEVEASLSELKDGTARPVAALVDGDATVSYGSLVEASGLNGITLTSAGPNDVRVTGKVPIIGEVTGTAEVTVVDGSHVRLRVTSLKGAAGSVSQTIINAYKDRLAVTLTLPKLPFNLELTKVQTESTGLIVGFTAKNVELA